MGSLGFALGVIRFIWGHGVKLGFALGVVGFILGHSGLPWGSLVCSGGRCVHPLLSGSLGFALWAVGFIRRRWVYSVSPHVSLSSSRVVGFSRVRVGGRWVHPGLLGSLVLALGSLGSSEIVGFSRGVVGFILGRRVH